MPANVATQLPSSHSSIEGIEGTSPISSRRGTQGGSSPSFRQLRYANMFLCMTFKSLVLVLMLVPVFYAIFLMMKINHQQNRSLLV
jgi:hypothetical protein